MKLSFKLTRARKLYLIVGSTAAGIIALVFFVVLPLISRVSELSQEVRDNKVQIEIFQRERQNLEETRKEYNSIKDDVTALDNLFVATGSYLDIITELEQLAQRLGIDQDIRVPQSTATGPFTGSITIRCGWTSCLNYFAELESLDYYLSSSDLLVTREGATLSVSFDIQAYENE